LLLQQGKKTFSFRVHGGGGEIEQFVWGTLLFFLSKIDSRMLCLFFLFCLHNIDQGQVFFFFCTHQFSSQVFEQKFHVFFFVTLIVEHRNIH
jgi:hypothetical protein